MNPFDWPGPAFLGLYIPLLVAALVTAFVLRWVLRAPIDDPSVEAGDLSPYEIAYLTGGERAATDAAIVRLVHRGVLQLDWTTGRLSRRGEGRLTDAHPLEHAIDNAAGAEPGKKLADVRLAVAATARKLRARLDELGLLVQPSQANIVCMASSGVMLLAGLFGLVKFFVGLERHRPVGFLVLLLIGTAIAAVVFFVKRPLRSRRGDKLLDDMTTRPCVRGQQTRERSERRRPCPGDGVVRRRGTRGWTARPAASELALTCGNIQGGFHDQRVVMRLHVRHLMRRRRRRRRWVRWWWRVRRRLRRRWLWRLRRMNTRIPHLGLGIGWRPELALPIHRRRDLGFVELMVEDMPAHGPLPEPIEVLAERGVTLIPHGVSLSLGSAEPPDPARFAALARLVQRCQTPLVSDHLAFVRGGGIETGHLLPLPRTRETLDVIVANIRAAQAALPVPLAIENVATLFDWPGAELDEATFLAEVLERADVLLLLDVENVYANCRNLGGDPQAFLDRLPLERIAYVHVAGGIKRDGLYHDTHAHPVPGPVLELLENLCARTTVPGVMLERDDRFPSDADLNAELDALAAATTRGDARQRAEVHHVC